MNGKEPADVDHIAQINCLIGFLLDDQLDAGWFQVLAATSLLLDHEEGFSLPPALPVDRVEGENQIGLRILERIPVARWGDVLDLVIRRRN